MSKLSIRDIRVRDFTPLESPKEMRAKHPLLADQKAMVGQYREDISRILKGEDKRLMVVVGPCSIHDTKAGLEYAKKLATLQKQLADVFYLVMRVYFEKPRTTVGWKGLINDPYLDGSCHMQVGIEKARAFLLEVSSLGLAAATEFLDPIVPQYISDLVSWAAIGARTTESQTHREMASGLSMPVGFKNATDGGLQVALDALVSAAHPHSFLGINDMGSTAIVHTKGNTDGHIILRGGGGVPNYSPSDIKYALKKLGGHGDKRSIMVDCSHGNSNKDYTRQPVVFESIIEQFLGGQVAINGVMIESNLVEGKQALSDNLEYGKSVTDGCISFETTEKMLLDAAAKLRASK